MAATTMNSPSHTAQVAQVENIRNTMSLSNLLSESTEANPRQISPDIAARAATLLPPPPPSTPSMSSPLMKHEDLGTPDTLMSDLSELEDTDEAADGGADVDDAKREFICMNDEYSPCKTGQITKDLSRKVISDHFGRNKACTRDIVAWPLFCRKHYQRATYNKIKWQKRKIQLILRQFDVIETQFPGMKYNVALKKSEEARLNQYSRQVAAGMANHVAEANVVPVKGKHFEAPIDVLRELDQYIGKGKTIDEVKKIVDVIDQMLDDKETDQVPSVEFLPQLSGKGFSQKSPLKAHTPKTQKTPSRVSTKGSVKKTKQKA
ncbi:hypothetical protein ACN47E_002074 [Coniothyrium glycines]